MNPNFWIAVVSREHVQRGVAGGFAQAGHGKLAPLKRMHAGDWLIYYSPKIALEQAAKCQCFTAIGQIADEDIYQVDMGGGFVPFRRNVHYRACQEVAILPLIPTLTFIQDKTHWGAPLRFGLLKITAPDFHRIAAQMLGTNPLDEE